jgi:hypothetical protein
MLKVELLGPGELEALDELTVTTRMSRLPWNFSDGPRGFQATS